MAEYEVFMNPIQLLCISKRRIAGPRAESLVRGSAIRSCKNDV